MKKENKQAYTQLLATCIALATGSLAHTQPLRPGEPRVWGNAVYVDLAVGDHHAATWQEILFEGKSADTFALAEGRREWTQEVTVPVVDGRLTMRVRVMGETTPAGIRELYFY